jgi:hypothetical protein
MAMDALMPRGGSPIGGAEGSPGFPGEGGPSIGGFRGLRLGGLTGGGAPFGVGGSLIGGGVRLLAV